MFFFFTVDQKQCERYTNAFNNESTKQKTNSACFFLKKYIQMFYLTQEENQLRSTRFFSSFLTSMIIHIIDLIEYGRSNSIKKTKIVFFSSSLGITWTNHWITFVSFPLILKRMCSVLERILQCWSMKVLMNKHRKDISFGFDSWLLFIST